jgi:putative peptidoglycan lipid II flippase
MVGWVGMMRSTVQIGLEWWSAWQEQSINRRIFAAMVTVGGFTVLVKLAAVAKDVAIAYQFGTSDELDAFLIAVLLPQFVITLIGGSLNSALIPTYIQIRDEEGPQAAQRLLSSAVVLSIGFLVAVSVILALTASYVLPLLASGFSAEKVALTRSLYYLMLSTLVLSGLATTWGAVLNSENRFALVAAVPVATSLVTIPAVVIMATQWGGYALAVGVVGGTLIEACLLGWGLVRSGISIWPRWCGISPAVKQVLGQYAPMVAAAFLMGGTAVVTQSMAARLDAGTVSALAYGSKVTNLFLGIGALAVGTAVLPHFSRMVTLNDWDGLRRTLFFYSRLLLLVTLPLTLVLAYLSEPLIAAFFQRGSFTEADTHVVSLVQVVFLLQIPPYVVGMLFVRVISALKANQLMLWGNIINLSLCVVLSYVLMQGFGVTGLALATSLTYFASCGYLIIASLRLIRQKSWEQRIG